MRRYKSEDGSYLVIDIQDGAHRLAWYLPEEADVGAYVGERQLNDAPGETDEERKARWEIMTADAAAKPFSCGVSSSYGYEFETRKQAQLALLAANESLLNGGAPMPQWATAALAAGWKPPKGWKP